jgi:putative membrane protein
MVALIQGESWDAIGHATDGSWLVLLSVAGAWLALGLFAVLVLVALLRNSRYRATSVFGEADVERVRAELADVEKRTIGEVVPVVLERSDAHPHAPWMAALALLVAGTAAAAPWLPWDRPVLLLCSQIGWAAVGFLATRALPDLRRRFVSERRATEMAQEQALQEFHSAGLHRTAGHTGVLLFVSLLEHRVIVLGDSGIDAVVDTDLWEDVDRAVLAGIKSGDLCAGLSAGLAKVGDVLAEHFPWEDGDRNEVPDRVIVRRE